MSSNNSPIGIFDSGVGGLSVLSELVNVLPNERYIYFGDTANLPYGDKTKEELLKISMRIFEFFKVNDVKAVVMACNTTSANVYNILKTKYNFIIYPIIPIIAKYIALGNYDRVGVFATKATVNSHAYKKEIETQSYDTLVYEIACPSWVSMVENSSQYKEQSLKNIKMMMNFMLQYHPDKIILGCTHYPYLLDCLIKYAPCEIFINPAEYFAEYIKKDLEAKNLLCEKMISRPKFYVSADHTKFERASSLFYYVEKAMEVHI